MMGLKSIQQFKNASGNIVAHSSKHSHRSLFVTNSLGRVGKTQVNKLTLTKPQWTLRAPNHRR